MIEVSGSIAGAYCGRLFADLGAEVRLTGRAERREQGGERPLFAYLHAGKRPGTEGDPSLRELTAMADIVVVEADHLPPSALEGRRPGCVVVAITPWGLSGPWSQERRPWSEFTVLAESGALARCGLPESHPLRIGGRQTFWLAGSMAASAALAAHLEARHGGTGEVVDIALLDVAHYGHTMFSDAASSIRGDERDRAIVRRRFTPSVEPAADGWVGFNIGSAQNLQDFMVLIERPDYLDDPDMLTYHGRYARYAEWSAAVRAWTTRHTVQEIVDLARLFRIPVAPVHNGETILTDAQTVARGFYTEDPTGSFRHPVVPFRFDGKRPARPDHVVAAPPGDRPAADRPFEGLRVIELCSWWAGSYVGTFLAALGADVIKVESPSRVDGCRLVGGTLTDAPSWWEYSNYFLGINHNKRSLTLDLSHPEGLALLKRLLAGADVLLENFAPRVLPGFGLDWEHLHALNERLVVVRMPAFGLDGPLSDLVGFAQTVEQYSGMCWVTGYPGGDPLNCGGAADPMSGSNAAFATLCALARREREGVGTLVESPLAEAALVMTSEQVIEWTANGRLLGRTGNREHDLAPQGVYAGAGEENWLALTVTDDAAWAALKQVAGLARWDADASLDHVAGRLAQHDELDRELAAWMSGRDATETAALLRARGVPAAAMTDPRFAHEHPQLAARLFETVTHPLAGTLPLPVLPFRFHGRGGWSRSAAPTLGRHNTDILAGELGLDEAEIRKLAEENVIGTAPLGARLRS
ncbi:crotonobetainyl-CoA:carnitine CoA-transferase CaiB-like acyl-CoA transferase [Thermocatellispora tengchongensis]|uniref:Crotonobetainyl-CoA:carnitine CoA-transferase CaiB-like acyl-CoA transferase n=1 Tax=Thermocatellispora tengchongensis TaxID=1073253 RepID=A0A840PH26_9ACTN|nr:crotonobetainyl-CoA:carnitine CoA-transferase CaiB-like acyl-CoA transferase [Thermocatellispora tengchongensis]